MKERLLTQIKYHKVTESHEEEVTERVIIPTFVPRPKHLNVKAIDVTDLSVKERDNILSLLKEYNEYVTTQQDRIFSFEQFISNINRTTAPSFKWRTFKPQMLEEVKQTQ